MGYATGAVCAKTLSSDPIAASHGFPGEDWLESEVDGLNWGLEEGAVTGVTGDCCGTVGAEATTWVPACGTHCWEYEPGSATATAAWGAGETGLGVEGWICWLIAA